MRWNEKIGDFNKALIRLEEAINESKETPESSTLKDGVIQRFEFTYELCWKIIKYFLEKEGIQEAKSPKSTFREAFSYGMIENGELWIEMLNDRNLTSHVYDEEIAINIYDKIIKQYFSEIKSIYLILSNKEVE